METHFIFENRSNQQQRQNEVRREKSYLNNLSKRQEFELFVALYSIYVWMHEKKFEIPN